MRKKIVISIFVIIITLGGIYLYLDRQIIALKTGITMPLQWDDPYNADQEEPVQLTQRNQTLSNPNVKITPVYYFPESKKIQFGFWYSKKEYHPDLTKKIPDRIFQVSVQDEEGQLFNKNTVIKTSGVLDEFQRRSIAVDLNNQDSIKITISLVKQDGTALTPIESSSFNIQLE